jgi:NhaP-type Na+/H+ or K+/H+ antiporter
MDNSTLWFLIAGALFISMALAGSFVARVPLSPSIVYLIFGAVLGPGALGMLQVDAAADARMLETLTEIAVIISLFTAGLKLRLALSDRRWSVATRLAVVSMVATVCLVAAVAAVAIGLPWGVGVILGAVLAPTDPVLASDVQVEHPFDENRLRFGLTGEASLNDGTAFPFLILGLGLLGQHELGAYWTRWAVVDLLWASSAGLAIGGILGTAVAHLVLWLRQRHKESVGLDDFLALGLIATAYGLALACHAYGFLAVFAAGLALRRVERRATEHKDAAQVTVDIDAPLGDAQAATDVTEAPAYMARAVLSFNEHLERIGEVAIVVVIGAMLSAHLSWSAALWAGLLLCIIRPVAVAIGLIASDTDWRERALIGWFGIRGIGSIYYLAYALTHGLPRIYAAEAISVTLTVIAASIVLHGVTVTPLMNWWNARSQSR